LAAIQCAAVAPTFPEPTMLTLLRMMFPFENQFTTEGAESTEEIRNQVIVVCFDRWQRSN
jgi:hypothetical protein